MARGLCSFCHHANQLSSYLLLHDDLTAIYFALGRSLSLSSSVVFLILHYKFPYGRRFLEHHEAGSRWWSWSCLCHFRFLFSSLALRSSDFKIKVKQSQNARVFVRSLCSYLLSPCNVHRNRTAKPGNFHPSRPSARHPQQRDISTTLHSSAVEWFYCSQIFFFLHRNDFFFVIMMMESRLTSECS